MFKNTFLNEISSKIWIFKVVLDLIDVYQYHTPCKNSPSNSTQNRNFEVCMQFFELNNMYYLSQIYSICPSSSMFVGILKIMD